MKRILNICAVALSFLLLNISCEDDWLKPSPLSFYAPENVYVNESGFRAILTTARINLKAEYYNSQHLTQLEFSSSDLCTSYQFNWDYLSPSSSQYQYLDFFISAFQFLKNVNVLISRIDEVVWEDQQVRNSLLAEALFYRSYWYYRLVHSYGDIPWVGNEISGAKLDFYTHSRWAILDKIQSDMEFAVQWLPESADIGYPTKYAGYHLLAKIYLANTEFDKAIASSTIIIDGPFELMTQRFGSWKDDNKRNVLWDLHRVENKNLPENTETIFTTIDRFTAPDAAKSDGTYAARMYVPSWWMVTDETGARGVNWNSPMGDTLGQGNFDALSNYFCSHGIWSEFGYKWNTTPDLRRSNINWVEMEEIVYTVPTSPQRGQPLSKQYYANLEDTMWMWRSWPHYKTYMPPELGKPGGRPRGGNGDWYVFRLADTYLLRAEAYFWKDQLTMAAADINVVRQRANAILISPTDVTIDYIFHERARELYTEEPRHSEMVRAANIMAKLNIGGYSLDNFSQKNWYYDRVMRFNSWFNDPKYREGGVEAKISPYNVYWPIPQSVITANTLGHVNQNIGYPGSENNIPALETIEE